MASRAGAMSVQVVGLEKVEAMLKRIARNDLNVAKGELRQGTKRIAQDVAIPALVMGARASGVPIAPAMADTARTRTDRIVIIRIGAVNPRLSGFRSGVGNKRADARQAAARERRILSGRAGGRAKSGTSQSYRTTLAWGSDLGPHPKATTNHYAVGRNNRGHWVGPTLRAPGTWQSITKAYEALLYRIERDYGAYR